MELRLAPTVHLRDDRLFRIFLQDHLAAFHATAALLRRCLEPNRETPLGRLLAPLHVAVREDLLHLRKTAAAVEVKPSLLKNRGARFGVGMGRFKLNGRLVNYSPLSRVLELEGLLMLTVQRAATWRILEARAQLDGRLQAAGVDFASRAELAVRGAATLQRALVQEGGLSF